MSLELRLKRKDYSFSTELARRGALGSSSEFPALTESEKVNPATKGFNSEEEFPDGEFCLFKNHFWIRLGILPFGSFVKTHGDERARREKEKEVERREKGIRTERWQIQQVCKLKTNS